MVAVGQGVDRRHPGVLRHLRQRRLGEGPPDDRRRLAAEHPGGVGHRLALADAGQPAVDDHRVAAELGDAGRERALGPQGRLVEQHRDAARPGVTACRRTGPPSAASARSSTWACSAGLRSSSARKCRIIMPPAPWSPRPAGSGRAATKLSSCSAVMIKRRGQPEHVRPRCVDDEAGVQGGVGHLRRPPARSASRPGAAPGRGRR